VGAISNTLPYTHSTYYCSQDVATAFCALSTNGGQSYGPSVPIYTINQCIGIHGHVKVAPNDGTVYVPNRDCGLVASGSTLYAHQGMSVSTDNGATWTVRNVPDSTSGGGVDPSVGIGARGTLYFGYHNGDGHPLVAVTHDRGLHWAPSVDVGVNIVGEPDVHLRNITFPVVVAGDDDRAAFAFLGTATGGDYQNVNTFHGVWRLYVASTFDGGQTWSTVDATPNDPVQRGSVCNAGTTCGNDRNLFDFNDVTVDREGRVLVGYSDGCLGGCVNTEPNTYTHLATIARLAGGRRLFARYDGPDATSVVAPGTPAITATQDTATGAVTLSWDAPDNGGAPISGYNVYRGATPGSETLLATVNPTPALSSPIAARPTLSYVDTGAVLGQTYDYRLSAVSAGGQQGPRSPEVSPLPVAAPPSPFTVPGTLAITDTTGDQKGGVANSDLDIQSLSVAQPPTTTPTLVFTIKLADLSTIKPNREWRVRFFGPPNNVKYYAAMKSNAAAQVSFEYGTLGTTESMSGTANSGGTDSISGTIGGSYDQTAGTITLDVPTSLIQNPQPGAALGTLGVDTYAGTAGGKGEAGANSAIDMAPDSGFDSGSTIYTIQPFELPASGTSTPVASTAAPSATSSATPIPATSTSPARSTTTNTPPVPPVATNMATAVPPVATGTVAPATAPPVPPTATTMPPVPPVATSTAATATAPPVPPTANNTPVAPSKTSASSSVTPASSSVTPAPSSTISSPATGAGAPTRSAATATPMRATVAPTVVATAPSLAPVLTRIVPGQPPARFGPAITVDPGTAQPGDTLTVRGKGFAQGEMVTLALNGAALLTVPDAVHAGSDGRFVATFVVPNGLLGGDNAVSAIGNVSRETVLAGLVGRLPVASRFYFAGGENTPDTRSTLDLLNPGRRAATVRLTFYAANGATRGASVSVPAHSQHAVALAGLAGRGAFGLTLTANQPVAAQLRLLRPGRDGDEILGNTGLDTRWYLAEGYTGLTFHETVSVLNPDRMATARVTLHLLALGGKGSRDIRITIPAHTHRTIDVTRLLPGRSLSVVATSDHGIVVERTLTFSHDGHGRGYGLTTRAGTNVAATSWIFAEGTTAGRFETYLTVLNPGPRPAHVTARFYGRDGRQIGVRRLTVAGLSRANILLHTVVHASGVASTVVGDAPIIVERPEYFGSPNGARVAGSDAFGLNGGATRWSFAGGNIAAPNHSEFLLLFNPSMARVTVLATFYGDNGRTLTRRLTLAPYGRDTLDVKPSEPGLSAVHGVTLQGANGQGFVVEQTVFARDLTSLDTTQGLAQ